MKKLIKKVMKASFFGRNDALPLVTITLSKTNLLSNLIEFKKNHPNHQVAPVLKSNAYGHGLTLIANELENLHLPCYVIDSYFEAKALRNDGIKTPLLIIGFSTIDSIIKNNLKRISFTIINIDSLRELSEKINKSILIQLKIDTGMHRQGILIEEIDEAIKIIKSNKKINLEGICSHLSDADNKDNIYTYSQIEKWNKIVNIFKNNFSNLKYWHISATAGHAYKEARANLIRLGIGLYGITEVNNLKLKPVLEMKTVITGIKKINKGEFIGYNNTFTAERDMRIATIPVGYNEGVDRRLSNIGYVKIREKFCSIIGRVSMNITTIDVSEIQDIKIGDEVIVISSKKLDQNSIENIAKKCSTIPYEISVHIPQHLKRIVIN